MAFTGSYLTNLGKQSYLKGIHRAADTYKFAMYSNSATFTAATTAYTSSNEVTNGSVVPAGGVTLASISYGDGSSSTGYVDWGDISVTVTGTFTARGGLLYNTNSATNGGAANEVIAVIDFGADKTATDGAFTVTIPSTGTGLIRFGP
jgi:hypothetical protein